MSDYTKEILNSFSSLNRYSKRLLAVLSDVFLCFVCTWLMFKARAIYWLSIKPGTEASLLFDFNSAMISILIAIPIFWLFGLYRTILRYTNFSMLLNISIASSFYGILYLLVGFYILNQVPRPIGMFQPILLFFLITSSRLTVKYFFNDRFSFRNSSNKKKILVYGAGNAGRQLVTALEMSLEYDVVGFLDDNRQLHRQILLGKVIYSPSKLEKLVKTKNVNSVFLALPTINRINRNQIIEKLNKYKLAVKTLPSISEIADGKITLSDVKDINIYDLLNRDQIKPDDELLHKNINSKTVVVTGAGGSIGSELCRQIVKLRPTKLILLELNEFALYKINEELINFDKNLKIIPLLINVQNQAKLETIFETFKVETVYHAAAYKHVPLVEENICEGVKNNVFGTLSVVNASVIKKISNLVLISSDKAVRPTNIMGASKRLSELCMQALHKNIKDISTNFSIVRFGNVLESSGSVIPKFKKQIINGGPITLTHQNVTRYFMTVTEAAQLVIQAGAMGRNSEVFVLDMGESVKIKDLIYKMVNLLGFTIKDNKNPSGDIEIKIIGLRPGEKLYEELLIGDDPKNTNHQKIYKASDPYIPFNQLQKELDSLKILIERNKVDEVKSLLYRLLKLQNSTSEIVDHIYVEQNLNGKYKNKLSFIKQEDNKVIKLKS
jgi:FlaA1/EpsC-like NDP-sugar epimerase